MPRHQGQRTPFNRERNEGSKQYKLWRSMRVLRRFTVPDLIATAPGTKRKSVQCYVVRLARVGYLAREPREGNDIQIYRLVRNTGPYAPMLRRGDAVYDPNKKAVFDREVVA
jgi:hypothetical protein